MNAIITSPAFSRLSAYVALADKPSAEHCASDWSDERIRSIAPSVCSTRMPAWLPMASFLIGGNLREGYGPDAGRSTFCRMRLEDRNERTIPRFPLLTGYESQRRLVGYHVGHLLDAAQAFGHRTKGKKHLAVRLSLHPHLKPSVIGLRAENTLRSGSPFIHIDIVIWSLSGIWIVKSALMSLAVSVPRWSYI